MDDEIRLKTDLVQNIALENTEYTAYYDSLFFEGDMKYLLTAFTGFDNLTIKPNDGKMQFDIKLKKELLEKFTDEDMAKIKQNCWQIQVQDMLEQKQRKKQTPYEKMMEEMFLLEQFQNAIEEAENQERTYREPTEEEKSNILIAKTLFKNILNMEFEEKKDKDLLSLEAELNEISLNYDQLNLLYKIIMDLFDIFLITPVYENDEDINCEKIIGIRLFLGIKLYENEE